MEWLLVLIFPKKLMCERIQRDLTIHLFLCHKMAQNSMLTHCIATAQRRNPFSVKFNVLQHVSSKFNLYTRDIQKRNFW